MNSFLQIIAIVLAGFSALLSIPVIIRLRQPVSPAWWGLKVFASAPAPYLAIAGAMAVILGFMTGPLWVILPGAYGTLFFLIYIYMANASMTASTGFGHLYGPDWEKRINAGQKLNFLSRPAALRLPPVKETDFKLEQDIPFCTIPSTERRLLCDIWRPSKNIKASGLAFIYFHGSAWCVLDKDYGTRTFFRHLVSQGHVIMDVAYRLFPETDMAGMVNDVYRAIAWMKTNASVYAVDPDRIVSGGASAGGHISMLAAYTCNSPEFIPAELQGMDLSVHAVISLYGPLDLEALYYHCAQHLIPRERPEKNKSAGVPQWVQKMMDDDFGRLKLGTEPGILPDIFGCHPVECPEVYAAFSPVTHVHKDCPPTLFIQGEHDLITPAGAAGKFYQLMNESGAPVAMYIIPQTDHAFDLVLPRISPVAHTVFYAVERFLALQVKGPDQAIQQKTDLSAAFENAEIKKQMPAGPVHA